MRSNRNLVLVTMCAGYFLVLLDVTIVNIALPAIGHDLHASPDQLQWVVDGYAVVLAGAMLTSGTIGDLYGHRRVVLAGLLVFGLASAGCGLAPRPGWLIAARTLQGAGAALLLPGTLAIINRAFPEAGERARAIGIWAAIGSLALPAGPLLGGALVQGLGWRAVFLVNLPVIALALPAVIFFAGQSVERSGRRLDIPGMLTGGLFLAALTLAFIEAGRAGLRSPATIGASLASPLLLVAFLVAERRAADPMLPLDLFRRPAFSVANLAAGVMNLCTLGMLFLMTQFLQDVQGRAALAAGLVLLPAFLPLALLTPVAGRVTGGVGSRLPAAAGLLVAGAGLAALFVVAPGTGTWTLVPALLAWGVGLAAMTPALVAAAMGAVERGRSGLASAVNNTARQAGGAIGIAAFGALAGDAAAPQRFLSGMHVAALIAGALYGVTALVTLAALPGRD